MKSSRIDLVFWRSCWQLVLLGLSFIIIREVALGTVFYDVFLSFDWHAYWEYFLANRLPTIILLIVSIPPITWLIFRSTLKELKQINARKSLTTEEQNYFTHKLKNIRRWLVTYFFSAAFLGLITYTIRGLGRVKLSGSRIFLELSPLGFSLMLLLFLSSLLLLWLDGNLRDLRNILNFYLTGDNKHEHQSRTIGITMIFCFGFVVWLVIYYGVILLLVKQKIYEEVAQMVNLRDSLSANSDLSAIYRNLRISLSDFAKELAYFRVFDARKMNLDNYLLPRTFSDYIIFIPIFLSGVFGFLVYLISYAHFYNQTLSSISLHVRSLLRKETSLKQQIVLHRFDDIGYLTGYLNLLFQLMHRALSGIHSNTVSLLQLMTNGGEYIKTGIQQLYSLNRVFARSGARVDTQVQMISNTNHGINMLNTVVAEIKNEIASQGEQLDIADNTVVNFNKTVEQVATHLQQARDSIDSLGKVAITGQQVVRENFEIVSQLTKISYSIRDIVNVIGRISAQTGLLSMNAAIEAAHAGEHGQGFSVVSLSIRQLSEDASTQNKAIRVQIKEMIGRVLNALDLTKTALASLRGIQSGVLRSQRLIETIAQAIDTQRQETDKLTERITELRQTTTLILQDTETQINNLDALSSSTDQLTTVVENLLKQEDEQLHQSSGVMDLLELLHSGIDEGLDETQSLSEVMERLRLD